MAKRPTGRRECDGARAWALAVAIAASALASARCGSPTQPTGGAQTVSGVELSATTIAAGGSTQATIKLTTTTSASVTVTLSSSNPAVLGVPSTVIIQSGTSSVTVTLTGVAPGTATVLAVFNGTTSRSPTLTVNAGAGLAALSLGAATIVGGQSVTGTVVLTAPAPDGGAAVTLSASDPVIVPATVVVEAGSMSAAFTVSTKVVSESVSVTVSGSFGGSSASAMLTVTAPTIATASFGVTGPNETETCTLTNGGDTIDCTFDGSTSTAPAPITAWTWSYGVAKTLTQTTSGPTLSKPAASCSLLPPPPFPNGSTWLVMTVSLTVRDSLGNVSATVTNNDVRLFPQGSCGY